MCGGHGPWSGNGAGRAVCAGGFPAGRESASHGHGGQPYQGAEERYFHAQLDGPENARTGYRETAVADEEDWLSDQVAGLFRAPDCAGPYVENVFRSNLFEFHRDLNKIGKPVDRTEWEMTPPTVNAYYDPSMNEIVFPAGILQPPFFNPDADDAINYGAMGTVIGHEMTHGFDDEGRQFDAHGNLVNWWTPDDLKRFEQRAECVEKQFDGYIVEDQLHENGKLVLGESIADLGGLTIAYAAFQQTPEAKSQTKIDGFTPDQRFFLGYAQIWAQNIRPQFARLLVSVDPHPLPRFRVNGPLSNMPAFAKAWDCRQGDPMVRPIQNQCKIW